VEVYRLAEPSIFPSVVVLVRTRVRAEEMLRPVSHAAKSLDPELFPEVQALEASFRQRIQTSEYAAFAASVLGLVALTIACVGIVGLVAFAVSERTREIGIRMALGAPPAHVVSVVLGHLARPVAVGLVVGVAGGAALSQVLRGVLYGVSHLDPVAYVSAVVVFLVAVALAALWPARRALRVDPCSALRYE
jgi:ABC-type antimicrobial peptide transport system permease subunit